MLIDTKKSPFAKVHSIDRKDIRRTDGFWQERFNDCADVTIAHLLSVFNDDDGYFQQVKNFRIAAGLSSGEFRGTPFGDGDFYKLLEGMAYAYARSRDAGLDAEMDGYIGLIGRAQQEDGYISTKQIIGERLANGVRRLGDIDDFEVYNFGHLFTAACIHRRITGKDNFLDIAVKAAGYLEGMYREAARTKTVQTAVCPSHYMGLIELYRTTGEDRFLKLAELSIALRDLVKNGTDDNQDRIPLREQHKITGHAVRSTYLYAGVADLYLETGDETLLPVLNDCWNDLFDKKLYINGGCGALYTGVSQFGNFFKAQKVHQAFGYEYQLPNITAYNETCGTLGHIFWTLRMFAINPQARYFDLIERSMYNLALAAVSLDGNKYFYENMLRRTKSLDYELIWPLRRESFFKCFCCPTNLSRSIMEELEYAYMVSDDAVWVGMYGSGEVSFRLESGAAFTLKQETEYPWNGAVRFTCRDVARNRPFTLKIRIPGWAEEGSICVVGGRRQALSAADADTYVDVPVENPARAEIEAEFIMKVRYTVAHPKVEEAVNQVAVERGPLVYCMETPDADAETIDDLFLLSDAVFETVQYELLGKKLIALQTEAALLKTHGDPDRLYQPLKAGRMKKIPVRMIPYFAWDNRGFGEMRIWMPVMYRFDTD